MDPSYELKYHQLEKNHCWFLARRDIIFRFLSFLPKNARVLKPGGTAIIFVPAHQFLWSEHDVVNHHKKRYSKTELIKAIEKNGLEIKRSGYWNFLLFFPICGIRLIQYILHRR